MTVQISGITDPETFERLPDALATVWRALQSLSLKGHERNWLECMLMTPEAEMRAVESIERHGVWELPVSVGGALHELHMRRALPGVGSVQCEEEQLPLGNRATSPGPK